jgi:RND family efflux transporter MFP subunit
MQSSGVLLGAEQVSSLGLSWLLGSTLLLAGAFGSQANADSWTVTAGSISDQQAVFATVESVHVVAARTQLGGIITSFSVQDGDNVTAGQPIATVADSSMAAQQESLDADITGLNAQLSQANVDVSRDQQLIRSGAIAESTLDQATTAQHVAASALKAQIAARAALAQQIANGVVRAPVSGRVLLTPLTQGSVVLMGDSIATIAEQNYVLRLDLPEHFAPLLRTGSPVRIDNNGTAAFGQVVHIYPQIQNGMVEADASAPGLGSYFVGQRIQVWVLAGARPGIVVPAHFITTEYGLDYVDLQQADGSVIAVPVQRGEARPTPDLPDGVEILSGLHVGEVLAAP